MPVTRNRFVCVCVTMSVHWPFMCLVVLLGLVGKVSSCSVNVVGTVAVCRVEVSTGRVRWSFVVHS